MKEIPSKLFKQKKANDTAEIRDDGIRDEREESEKEEARGDLEGE